MASSEQQRPQQQRQPGRSASPPGSGADSDPQQEPSSSSSSSSGDMAATHAELLMSSLQLSEPQPAPSSSVLEELQLLLHSAASAAETAGLLSLEPGELAGEARGDGSDPGLNRWK